MFYYLYAAVESKFSKTWLIGIFRACHYYIILSVHIQNPWSNIIVCGKRYDRITNEDMLKECKDITKRIE